MNGILDGRHEVQATAIEPVVTLEDLRFYVYLVDGRVEEVWPATGVRLTQEDLRVVLGEITVARYPRREVFFAGHARVAPPMLF